MARWLAPLALTLALAAPARATLIGDTHRAINRSYRSQDDGFQHGRIEVCRRSAPLVVDCRVLLTDPIAACQPGTQLVVQQGDGIGVCEAPGASERIWLRVRRGAVLRLTAG